MGEEERTTTSISARDESAESTNVPVKRRRRRRTAACVQCRNRKLKCDQEYPICGRCAKGPRPGDCTYQDAIHHQPPTGSKSSTTQPPVAGWGKSATVRVPDRSGVADVGGELSSADRAPLNQAHQEANINVTRVNGDELQHNSAQKSNAQFVERHLDYIPSSKRRKTLIDEASGLRGNLLEGTERYSLDPRSQMLDVPTKTYWRGKDCWTRFYGSSIIINMISEFSELKSYAKEIKAENPVLTKFRHDMLAVKERNRCHKYSAEKSSSSPIDSTSLFSLLPTRDIVEALVADYLTYVEPTNRVLHIPSFRRDFKTVWEQEPAEIQPTVLIQLLLVLACAWSFHSDAGSLPADEKTITCDTAKSWIRQCELWLQDNRVKRPGPETFRIRCLIIIARDRNDTKKSQAWIETGSLIKLAMSAGYHREPDTQYAKVSGFNREMRRRLWVTMVELDLQASLDRGMPPTVQQDDFDSIMPSNYNDEDISEEGELLQPSPPNVATDSSFQVALAPSLPLRLKICALVHAPRIRVTYEDLRWLEEEVMRCLSSIPNWQSPDTPTKPQQQQFILWRTLIETKLGQCLLTLLSSVTPEATISFNQFARSRLEIATTILCQQQRLLSDVNHGENSNDRTNKKLSVLYPLTAAALQAALVICHHLNTVDSGYTSKTIQTYLPSIPVSLLSLVEKTLTSLEPRIVLFEKGLKEYYILSMIVSLVKTKTAAAPDSSSAGVTYRKDSVDRAAVLGYRILAKKREKHGDVAGCDGDSQKKKAKKENRHAQEQHDQQQQPPHHPTQNMNTTTTPISMENTPRALGNLPTNAGNAPVDMDNNIQIPSLPQDFNFDFDFDWDFLLLDDVDVDMGLGDVGVPYPSQNLGGDGFGNFY